MITDNNFDSNVCKPYLTQIPSDMTVIDGAYESTIEVSENLDSELTYLRLLFEYHRL